MVATHDRVEAYETSQKVEGSELLDELRKLYGGNISLHLSKAVHPGEVAANIVAATACYYEAIHGKPIHATELQKVAFKLEKKLLKDQTHSWTTVSAQGGLMFYRKEFEFFRTVISIPAKFPREFVEHIRLQQHSPDAVESYTDARYIRRLIFAIMHEDLKLFKSTYDPHRVFPQKKRWEPSYQGVAMDQQEE